MTALATAPADALDVAQVSIRDTGDEFYFYTWDFRGRTYWACDDGRVRYVENGAESETTARARLDLSQWSAARNNEAVWAEEIRAWLVAHHSGINYSGTATALPSCDACEDDHASVVLADGTTVCAREGIDR